ncbi:MEDS domain-containing protein [Amycolatopsis deserti]|uniref:MEDS domain-containing protein n=1 Tax=Amycolatopsis deserti TaxID=185696 RepID=UPI001E4C181A|nr:MEDS domain-containing protein [Amycolatopsis deserti]
MLHDHRCWAFESPDEFQARAREFLRDGLARGTQVWFVTPGEPVLDGLDEALDTGAARVLSLDETYSVGTVVDPDAQARSYAEATEAALAAGYTGLRVAADHTALVATPEQLDAFARYEHTVDRYAAAGTFSAMCGYDLGRVDDEVVARVACLHPVGNADPGFRLFGSASASAALAGELDLYTEDLLTEALRRADPRPVDGRLVLDVSGLRFADHRSLTRLAEHAEGEGATLVLRDPSPAVTRLVEVLGLPSVRVEGVA